MVKKCIEHERLCKGMRENQGETPVRIWQNLPKFSSRFSTYGTLPDPLRISWESQRLSGFFFPVVNQIHMVAQNPLSNKSEFFFGHCPLLKFLK